MSRVELQPRTTTETAARTAFLVVDTESIPDGRLLNAVKFPGLGLTDEEAVDRAREEARKTSNTGSDFIPLTFQLPIAVCVIRVGADFSLQAIKLIDSPLYRPPEIAKLFWLGLSFMKDYKIVTFNGRGFDLPLLELAAFRYGLSAERYYQRGRNRYNSDLDLMDFMTNFGATRGFTGGLDLLAKLLGKPGKMGVSGDQVYDMYKRGQEREINDYCMFDTLDTYFVFLRTRVLTGDLTVEREAELVGKAKQALAAKVGELPALRRYLDSWADGKPGP